MTSRVLNFGMYVHGQWENGAGQDRLEIYNPAIGEVAATVPRGAKEDLEKAIRSSEEGLKTWRATHPSARASLLYGFAQRIRENADELAKLECLQSGQSLEGALETVRDVCARRFEYYAGLADKVLGDTFVAPGRYFSYTLWEPKGVTAHIIPWNGPLWVGSRSIAPALAAGNSALVKPSAEAPLSLLKLAELATESGIPHGVLNVVTGTGEEIGEAIAKHPDVRAIYFTGSRGSAQRVLKNTSENLTYSVMELGGKSPNIVMADADLGGALNGAIWGIFANAGQICVAGSRLLVQESIHDEFLHSLKQQTETLRLGGPDAKADMGPLISERQRERVLDYISVGRSESRLVTGGGIPEQPSLRKGYFVQPTIFDEVPSTAHIAQEEIFGPVLAVTPFRNTEDAIAMANATEYGLAAAVWTRDLRTAHDIVQRLEAGEIYVNRYFGAGFELSRTPFKASGFGQSDGPQAIYEYLNQKSVSIDMA